MNRRSMITDKRGGSMAEAAIALPAVLLVLFFGWNVSQAAFTAMAARQAADYGARVASVVQENNVHWVKEAVKASLNQSGAKGAFGTPTVTIVDGSDNMRMVRVELTWTHPTILTGLCKAVDQFCNLEFSGKAVAVWKWEYWRE
jgi:Flp pilus assembly protein TadG